MELHILQYQLIPQKAQVFLPCLVQHMSTLDITKLPIIHSNIIFQEAGYFEN
jgi:hypothetical protein